MKTDSQPAEIIENLFIGSVGTAYNKESLIENKITHIMSVAHECAPRFPNGFQYQHYPCYDNPNQIITKYFEKSNLWIKAVLRSSNKHRLLIHCHAGVSRATSFAVAYLCKEKGMRMRDALWTI